MASPPEMPVHMTAEQIRLLRTLLRNSDTPQPVRTMLDARLEHAQYVLEFESTHRG